MNNCFSPAARYSLACMALLGAAFAARAQADEYLKSYPLTGRATVQVQAQWGAVRVTTSTASKVEFDVTYEKRDWAADPPIESRQDGNVVTLTALVDERSWWGWDTFGNRRLTILVRMPKDADLQLQTTNGDIDVAAVDGRISIHTRNGRVNAQQLSGTIDIGSSNGAISVNALKGAVTVRTTNGPITADGLDGKCEVATTNGEVRVEGRFESLDVTSTNGSIFARAEPGSRMLSGWSILTTNGGVDLAIPGGLSANLDVNTHNGRIRLDVPVTLLGEEGRNMIRGTLNGGGPELSLRTTNAGIRVRGI